jgi:hypothetical protein
VHGPWASRLSPCVFDGDKDGSKQRAVSSQSSSAVVGQAATFTAQAFGTPAPDIAWLASTDGVTWTSIAGASSGRYTLAAPTLQDSGHAFRADIHAARERRDVAPGRRPGLLPWP